MTTPLVDTHCHLDSRYTLDPAEVMARAAAEGVAGFVAVGVGAEGVSAREAVALAEAYDNVAAVVGVHPHDAVGATPALRDEIARLAARPRVAAVGEIGLDYHYDHSPRETQREVFRHFIELARSLGKPIVIHTRNAPAETLEVLREARANEVGGVIHCFSEDRAFARGALDLGFDLSFSGIVTFKTAKAIQDVAAWAPADRILVETDAPYLAPVPLRGKPCEPAYVVHTARFVAGLRGVDPGEIARLTTANALRRFGHVLRLRPPAVDAGAGPTPQGGEAS